MRARFHTPTRSRAVRPALALALLAGPAVVAGASLAPAAAEPAPRPSLRLYVASDQEEVSRPKGEVAWAHLPVWVTPVGGTFDLRVQRADYRSDMTVRQVVHESDGTTTSYDLPDAVTREWNGLGRFSTTTITDPRGAVTKRAAGFCPNNWELQRIEPGGVDTPTFPEWCGGQAFTLGAVWGLDDGWGTPVTRQGGVVLRGPVGDYTVTTTIAGRYREMFGIPAENATATVVYHVSNGPGEPQCRGCRTGRPESANGRPTPRPHVRVVDAPPTDQLPDLEALPSFGIDVDHRRGKDYLAFASTVWIGGTSKMDIEGFRRPNEDRMDAYQYFYDGNEVVGRARIGELEFDTRRNHHHWHLDKFAQYRLLDADKQNVRLSKKQSFCLAPTDPVDLALDGAAWRQDAMDLGSACGGEEAIWIRETLPLGWGDTYYQSRGGQDFNITDVPNGTYFVSIKANPTDELFETDTSNNESLRKVILKGRKGHRTVCVPAVGVIPAEGSCGAAQR